jgi:hypothetical protein
MITHYPKLSCKLCAFNNFLVMFEETTVSRLLAIATPGINNRESCNSKTLISADLLHIELGKKCKLLVEVEANHSNNQQVVKAERIFFI